MLDDMVARFQAAPDPFAQATDAAAKAIADADLASQLMGNALWLRYWDAAEQQVTERMLALPVDADVERYRLSVAVQAIRAWRLFLEKTASEGAYAQENLKRVERVRAYK